MSKGIKNSREKDHQISSVETTNDCITNRAGLTLFATYLQSIQLMPIMDELFCAMRKNKKGAPVVLFYGWYQSSPDAVRPAQQRKELRSTDWL